LLRERDDPAGARRDAEAFAEALFEDPVGTFGQLTSHWPKDEQALLAAKPEVVIELAEQAIMHGGLGYFIDNMASWQPWPQQFNAIAVPVHVFHGEKDQWSPIRHLRHALAGLLDVRWTTYAGDHLSPFTGRDRQVAMLDIAC
jgi:pimeloyl-ACP methyl ester carboxylesterase